MGGVGAHPAHRLLQRPKMVLDVHCRVVGGGRMSLNVKEANSNLNFTSILRKSFLISKIRKTTFGRRLNYYSKYLINQSLINLLKFCNFQEILLH